MTTKHDFIIQRYRDGEVPAPVRRVPVNGKNPIPRGIPADKLPFVEVGMYPTARNSPAKDFLIPEILALRTAGVSWVKIAKKLKVKGETAQTLAKKGGLEIKPLARGRREKKLCLSPGCRSYEVNLGLCGRHCQQWRNTGGERCEQCGAAVCEHTAKLGRIA